MSPTVYILRRFAYAVDAVPQQQQYIYWYEILEYVPLSPSKTVLVLV